MDRMNRACTISKNRNTGITRNTRNTRKRHCISLENLVNWELLELKMQIDLTLSIKNKCSFSLFYLFDVFLVADLYSWFLHMRLSNYFFNLGTDFT